MIELRDVTCNFSILLCALHLVCFHAQVHFAKCNLILSWDAWYLLKGPPVLPLNIMWVKASLDWMKHLARLFLAIFCYHPDTTPQIRSICSSIQRINWCCRHVCLILLRKSFRFHFVYSKKTIVGIMRALKLVFSQIKSFVLLKFLFWTQKRRLDCFNASCLQASFNFRLKLKSFTQIKDIERQ